MSSILALIRPRWQSFRKGRFDTHRKLKTTLLLTVGIAFWGGIFGISVRVLTYFQQIEELGDILSLLNLPYS